MLLLLVTNIYDYSISCNILFVNSFVKKNFKNFS